MAELQVLDHILDPTQRQVTAFRDPILIAVDTEFGNNPRRITQLGIVTLNVHDVSLGDNSDTAGALVHGICYHLEKRRSTHNSLFRYGETLQVNESQILCLLQEIFPTHSGGPGNIFLVGHDIKNDISILKQTTGYDISRGPSVKMVFDTQYIAGDIFGHRKLSLKHVMQRVGLERKSMHNAGNDAVGTLKALLLLFCNYKERKMLYQTILEPLDTREVDLWQCQLEALKNIACSTVVRMLCKRKGPRPAHEGEPSLVDSDLADDEQLLAIFGD